MVLTRIGLVTTTLYKGTRRFFDFWDSGQPEKVGVYQVQLGNSCVLAYDQGGRVLGTVEGADLAALGEEPAAMVRGYSDGCRLSMVRFDLRRARGEI